jgi:hypothetical protein
MAALEFRNFWGNVVNRLGFVEREPLSHFAQLTFEPVRREHLCCSKRTRHTIHAPTFPGHDLRTMPAGFGPCRWRSLKAASALRTTMSPCHPSYWGSLAGHSIPGHSGPSPHSAGFESGTWLLWTPHPNLVPGGPGRRGTDFGGTPASRQWGEEEHVADSEDPPSQHRAWRPKPHFHFPFDSTLHFPANWLRFLRSRRSCRTRGSRGCIAATMLLAATSVDVGQLALSRCTRSTRCTCCTSHQGDCHAKVPLCYRS